MKNTLFTILLSFALFNFLNAQNIDSFMVSDNAPNFYDSVYLINLSTNYTSLEWIVSNTSFHPLSGFPNDSIVIGRFNKTGCHDISLIIGRGTNYDTITKTCAVQVFDREPPTLVLLKPIDTIEVYDSFIDWGYLVIDNYCDESSIKVYTSGSIDSSILGLGSYKIWAVDCEGNSSDTLTREVWVLDRTPPVIEWKGQVFYYVYRWDSLKFNPLDSIIVADNYDKEVTVDLSGNYYSHFLKDHSLGFYYISFIASDSSGNKSKEFRIYIESVPYSINENNHLNYTIFPNPNSGHFTIENQNPNQAIHSVSVFNQMGQEVYFKEIDRSQTGLLEIEIRQPSGIYFIQAKNEKGISLSKILIE
ncbi:MAG: T9SS type A sorting domain-containing protein [Bacteroidetes bacterium]|jgi:hypothetical protein|nr:T9SS type A sorting domain-containing protein [Bacteroidota bacterium]MBT5529177.1 T9SS type A sorting domain-containing protein [Cytophagia bacterium]MBT4339224.1 T9SS type A sorting domain-containing protein [Bacteroidota bacterium]MBT4729497.1 T9SS type A sorting domain-containing protein [Bacteroidota bacterium]MBT4970146.1 T9SS type A sorting domain-containing protein [Bacteroidota bacterium]